MYFYANLSCDEAYCLINVALSSEEFGFFSRFYFSAWLFLATSLAVFGLFYWMFGLFRKTRSGNPGDEWSPLLPANFVNALNVLAGDCLAS